MVACVETCMVVALPVGCICLSAATGKHLLCYRQPLAIGGVGVELPLRCRIMMHPQATLKKYANGATVLSK